MYSIFYTSLTPTLHTSRRRNHRGMDEGGGGGKPSKSVTIINPTLYSRQKRRIIVCRRVEIRDNNTFSLNFPNSIKTRTHLYTKRVLYYIENYTEINKT